MRSVKNPIAELCSSVIALQNASASEMMRAARLAVGKPRDRYLRERVEDAERRAGEQAELRIGELQVLADRHQQQIDDGAVDDVEGADAEQDRERVVV